MSSPSYLSSLNLSGYGLEDEGTLKNEITGLNIAFIALVVLVTVLRISVRVFMIHATGVDNCKLLINLPLHPPTCLGITYCLSWNLRYQYPDYLQRLTLLPLDLPRYPSSVIQSIRTIEKIQDVRHIHGVLLEINQQKQVTS
jgi:hypothetical protein